MNKNIETRVLNVTECFLENNTTVREISNVFGFGKSTIHLDLTMRLSQINPALANKVKAILDKHKKEKHITGGNATKEKYARLKENS